VLQAFGRPISPCVR